MSKTLISRDRYSAKPQIIVKGTKKSDTANNSNNNSSNNNNNTSVTIENVDINTIQNQMNNNIVVTTSD